jgi:hypothetical protein
MQSSGVKKALNHAIVVRRVKAQSVAQVTAARKLYASNPNHGIDRFVDDKTAAKKSEVSKFFVQQEKTRVLCR